MVINRPRFLALAAVAAGAYWLVNARKDNTLPEFLYPIADSLNSGWGFIKVGMNNAGDTIQDAFDLANSDFKTSLTSGRGNQYTNEIERIGQSKGLPPFLLSRIAYQESRFRPDAYNSGSKAAGMFQIVPITVKELKRQMGKEFDPYIWQQAAEGSAVYLAYLYRMFGNWLWAVAAYNSGPGTFKKHLAENGGKFVPSKMPQAEQRVYSLQVMADISLD